ncbi:MAG TPA: PDZ domain-containing protein [Planctomycetia bacterium]|nr:PDZ domain-containing protein [Planctomycetia bacterium]
MRWGKEILTACLAIGIGGPVYAQDSDADKAAAERKLKAVQAEADAARRAAELQLKAAEAMVERAKAQAAAAQRRAEEAVKRMKEEMAAAEKRAAANPGKKETFLGVVTEPVPPALAAHVPAKKGLLVARILPGSPAEKAGLQQYDILLGVNSTGVETPQDLKKVVTSVKAGETVKLRVFHEGKETGIAAKLEERESGGAEELIRKVAPKVEGFRFKMDGMPGSPGEIKRFRELAKPGAPGAVKVPGGIGIGVGVGGGGKGVNTVKIAINDGKYEIAVEAGEGGKDTRSWKFSGSKEEVLKAIGGSDMPEALRGKLKSAIESSKIESSGDRKPGSGEKIQKKVRAMVVGPDGKVTEADPKVHGELLEKIFHDKAALHEKGMHELHLADKALHDKLLNLAKDRKLNEADMKKLHEHAIEIRAKVADKLKDLDLGKLEGLDKQIIELRSGLDGKLKDLHKLEGLDKHVIELRIDAANKLKDLDFKKLEGLEKLKDLDVKIATEIEKSIKDAPTAIRARVKKEESQ